MAGDSKRSQGYTSLARLLGDTKAAGFGPGLWQRLDLEAVARRLIQTARMAAAEHSMMRLHEAIIRRGEARATEHAADGPSRPAGAIVRRRASA